MEGTRAIDIEIFVEAIGIDRLYWDNPYFLVPDGKLAIEAFIVIREAMAKTGQVALGRVVMRERERMLAVEPRGTDMIAWSLRSHDELRDPAALFDDIADKKADPKMIAIAGKIIEGVAHPYRRKALGQEPQGQGAGAHDSNVVDLMAALRQSLAGNHAPTAKAKPATKTARPRTRARR